MTSLLSRWVGRRSKGPIVHVTVYSREQCCCCHTAIDVLEQAARKRNLAIEVVDVDSDPELAKAHGLSVPVVEIDGKIRFRGVVNPVLLDRLLANRESE